ncbi:MAG TPA: hypothetical protein VF529_02505 [Solirubrobacteraceae bacterium]|jgi:hypothetical protein
MAGGFKAFLIAAALIVAAATTGATLSAYSSTAQNSGSTFSTAASYNTCPNTTLIPAYLTGFENGRKNAHSDNIFGFGNAAATSIQTTTVRSGAYALKAAPVGGSAYLGWWNQSLPATETIRFAIRFETLPTANVGQLFAVTTVGSTAATLKYVSASKTFAFALSGNTTVTSSSSVQLAAGQWYVIDVRFDPSTATHQLAWRLDGVAQPSVSVASTATTVYDHQLGTNGADTYTAYYDDLMLVAGTSAYPLGDGRVYGLKPDGMGNLTPAGSNFINNDSTALNANSWQRLDELPMIGITDYISQNVLNANSYAEITFANTTETCIRAAATYITWHTGGSKSTTAGFRIYDGTAQSTVYQGEWMHQAGRDLTKAITPATTWSQSALNGLVGRFGYWSATGNPSNPPSLDGALIEYEVPQ